MNSIIMRLRQKRLAVRAGTTASLLLMVLALLTPSVSAQATPEPGSGIRTISVSGTGTINVDPDTADVSLSVQSISKSLKTAQDNVTESLSSVTGVLTGAGVAPEDVVTSSYDIYAQNEYDDNGNFKGISGFSVSATLTVTIRDITTVGTILDAAVTGGANGVNGISFYTADPSGPASQARTKAIDDARAKADEIATAAGVQITGVYSIQETSAPEAPPVPYEAAAVSDSSDRAPSKPVPINPGQSEIRVDVQVVFEIEQANG